MGGPAIPSQRSLTVDGCIPIMSDGKPRSFTEWGCYPIFYVTRDSILCPECAARAHESDEDNLVRGADVNWEDPDMRCSDCSERIESAYAETTGDPEDV